jgi:DNA-binding NarL/FixJ family response regulator
MRTEFTKPHIVRSGQSAETPKVVSNSEPVPGKPGTIIVIEKRVLIRECLAQCFMAAFGGDVVAYPSVEEWRSAKGPATPSTVVLSTGGSSKDAAAVKAEISLLSQEAGPLLLILLADAEEPSQIVDALERGARGYIATSSSMAIAIEAVRLVRAGGVYVPAESMMAANRSKASADGERSGSGSKFTARQSAVLSSLRKGMSNKVIAHQLDMRESTVKVHIRSIMRKLGAKNRTEVAYLAQNLLDNEGV